MKISTSRPNLAYITDCIINLVVVCVYEAVSVFTAVARHNVPMHLL